MTLDEAVDEVLRIRDQQRLDLSREAIAIVVNELRDWQRQDRALAAAQQTPQDTRTPQHVAAGVIACAKECARYNVGWEALELAVQLEVERARNVAHETPAPICGNCKQPWSAKHECPIAGEAYPETPAPRPAEDYKALYYDLIYQVWSKYPGETRHDTAKRYIQQHERVIGTGMAARTSPAPRPEDTTP